MARRAVPSGTVLRHFVTSPRCAMAGLSGSVWLCHFARHPAVQSESSLRQSLRSGGHGHPWPCLARGSPSPDSVTSSLPLGVPWPACPAVNCLCHFARHPAVQSESSLRHSLRSGGHGHPWPCLARWIRTAAPNRRIPSPRGAMAGLSGRATVR